jgi:hypothetical protein
MKEQPTIQTRHCVRTTTFSASEWSVLRALRVHYQETRDLFSARELGHLSFMRWLYRTGRIVP